MKRNLNFRRLLSVFITVVGCLFIVASCNFPKKENKETFDMAAAKKVIEEQNFIFTEAMNKSDSV